MGAGAAMSAIGLIGHDSLKDVDFVVLVCFFILTRI